MKSNNIFFEKDNYITFYDIKNAIKLLKNKNSLIFIYLDKNTNNQAKLVVI